MKKINLLLLSLIFVMWFTSNASALPMTWSDTHSANEFMNDSNDYYHYSHNITRDGFDPGVDLVTSWDIKLSFTDDSDMFRWEWAIVDLPGLIGDRFFEVSFNEDIYTGFSVAGILSLNRDGILGINIYQACGDFWFKGSTLNAYGFSDHFVDDGDTPLPVPEPANILLLGTGLIGIATFSRKKYFNKA